MFLNNRVIPRPPVRMISRLNCRLLGHLSWPPVALCQFVSVRRTNIQHFPDTLCYYHDFNVGIIYLYTVAFRTPLLLRGECNADQYPGPFLPLSYSEQIDSMHHK